MKSEILTIRVSEEQKEEIKLDAKKMNQHVSEYILGCVKDKKELSDLNDSQGQFLNLFDIAFKKSYDSYFKREMLLLNKINFNLALLVNAQNIFMKQLKIPQNRDDVITSFVEHPIMTIAHENTVKNFRNLKSKNEKFND